MLVPWKTEDYDNIEDDNEDSIRTNIFYGKIYKFTIQNIFEEGKKKLAEVNISDVRYQKKSSLSK